MLRAAVWPVVQRQRRESVPRCGSGQREMSPAVKITGTLVRRYLWTMRSILELFTGARAILTHRVRARGVHQAP